jgi:hypothetical protein
MGPDDYHCAGLAQVAYLLIGKSLSPFTWPPPNPFPDDQHFWQTWFGDGVDHGHIAVGQLKKGDLVFRNSSGADLIPGLYDHVGIVVGVNDDLALSINHAPNDLRRDGEICNDHIDNDLDGFIDWQDSDCDHWLRIRIKQTGEIWVGRARKKTRTSAPEAEVVLAEYDFNDGPQGWTSFDVTGYGDYAGLQYGTGFVQGDECGANGSMLWSFTLGSDAYSCDYPSQTVVPGNDGFNNYIANEIRSPSIALSGASDVELSFDVYEDLDLSRLVFFTWRARCHLPGEGWMAWRNTDELHYSSHEGWITAYEDVGAFLQPGSDSLQVALGVVDMCGGWCEALGTDGYCHSHAPLFDNVSVRSSGQYGPQWRVDDDELFQDSFPENGTVTGTVRADIAADTRPRFEPYQLVVPGDSAVVTVGAVNGGVAFHDGNPSGGPAVYCFVRVTPPQPTKTGVHLSDDPVRWPVVDSVTVEGSTWYVLRMDSTRYDVDSVTVTVPERFCIDLNDALFTPRDTVSFFYKARGYYGDETYWSLGTGTTADFQQVISNPMEFTCLPANALTGATSILFVDACDYGEQPYFDTAFEQMDIMVDRFDVRAPSSIGSNGLASRVTNVFAQLLPYYQTIIWSAGPISDGTIGDGSGKPSKSDDAALLTIFLDQLETPGGVYLCGNDVARELEQLTGSAYALRNYIGYSVVSDDHVPTTGLSPLVVGAPSGMFGHPSTHPLGPDTLVAFGGCPVVGDFDVLSATGSATVQAYYKGPSGSQVAIVAQTTTNGYDTPVGVVLSGFGYDYIRDDRPTLTMDRAEHLRDILSWLGHALSWPVGTDEGTFRNSLAQNYPNPFNPTTTISYSIAKRAQVRLVIFDVRGALVRTVVDGPQVANAYSVVWDGRDDRGNPAASGVYFYRLIAGGFRVSKKLVLIR